MVAEAAAPASSDSTGASDSTAAEGGKRVDKGLELWGIQAEKCGAYRRRQSETHIEIE